MPHLPHTEPNQRELDLPNETLGEALARIRADSRSEREKGTWFENLARQFLAREPTFEVSGIWTWRDWPEREQLTGLDGRDMGIDLVAKLHGGEWVAIQCKFYAESRRISRDDIDRFLAESGRKPFAKRWMVVTCPWGRGAEQAVAGKLLVPVHQIDFMKYADRQVREVAKPEIPLVLDGKRLEAVDAVVDGLDAQGHDRGKLIMACGTGKTFVSLKVAERLVPDRGRVLFAAPSIALVSQARQAWLTCTARPMRSLVVCSDAGAGGSGESDRAGLDDLVCPVATDPEKIAAHLRGGDGVRAVFSTYQSLNKVIAAQKTCPDLVFDLAVADEAHRTAGVEGDKNKAFQDFHRADALQCRKRLYMTATPRIYSPVSIKQLMTRQARGKLGTDRLRVYDMSDPAVFGRQLYRLTFKEAVQARMLSDYRVIVLGVRSEWVTASVARLVEANHKVVTPSDATRLLGVSLAVNGHIQGRMDAAPPGPLGRNLAFANTIARSKWYAATINDPELRKRTTRRIRLDRGQDAQAAMHVVAEHLDGSDSVLKRNRGLRHLRDGGRTHYECRMVCNAKLFTEGVDVPQLDSVVFLDPRAGHIDIVQAVGRVMRKSEGKRFGYIIIPIALREGENMVDALDANRDGFKVVGDVLRALQSHDERLADNVARFVQVVDPPAMALPRDDSAGGEMNAQEPNGQGSLVLSPADAQVYAKISAAFGLSGRERGRVTANWIEDAVTAAASILARDECEGALAEALTLHGIESKNLYKIAALILCNALLMHKRLLGAIDITGVEKLDAIIRHKAPAEVLIPSWERVLKRDYAPIFAPALAVLVSLRTGPNANEAVGVLATCAETVADSLSEMGYDHAGPLYHRILPSAESDGAFYTHNVAAVLLSRLALDDEIADWSDFESVCGLRIIDPACGTGTLLMAALKTIKDRATEGGAFADDNLKEAHQRLVASSVRGLDINWHALQLAASNLTLGAPTVDYKAMHLHAMRHGLIEENRVGGGGQNSSARTGSLELIHDLVARRRPDLLAASSTAALTADFIGTGQVAGGRDLDLRDMSAVLMNPPFSVNTRSSSKFGTEGQKEMRRREDAILATIRKHDPEAANAITKKTPRKFFTLLADLLLRKDVGVLAKVLPFAASTSSTGRQERRFLSDRFEVSIVVTSHAGSFSAATRIHECLLVCRRRPKERRRNTLFATLRQMPENADQAVEVAEAILSGELAPEWGTCYRWPRARVEAGDWSASQWMDGVLAEAAHSMSVLPGLRPLGALANVGPAHVRSEMRNPLGDPSDGPYRVLWRHRTADQKTMRSTHDFSVEARPGKERQAEKAWTKASRLLIANKLRTTVARVTAVLLEAPAVGSAWTPASVRRGLTGDSFLALRAWCAWLNSTPGLLGFLHRRGRTLDYSDFMPNKLNSLPCPDPSQINLAPLASAYDELRERPLQPWPRLDECPVRTALDDIASEAVGLDRETVAGWRHRLVREATIGGVPASSASAGPGAPGPRPTDSPTDSG